MFCYQACDWSTQAEDDVREATARTLHLAAAHLRSEGKASGEAEADGPKASMAAIDALNKLAEDMALMERTAEEVRGRASSSRGGLEGV
eukprot:971801-Prorocentrum_minimum.AAC.1